MTLHNKIYKAVEKGLYNAMTQMNITESFEVCANMEFLKIDFGTAYQWLLDNDSELLNVLTKGVDNANLKYFIMKERFMKTERTKMHYILLNNRPMGILGFDSLYNTFYDEKNDRLTLEGLFPSDVFHNGIGKRTLWVSFLEIKYMHSIENITSVM